MKKLNKLAHVVAGLGLVLPAAGYSNVSISDRPLFVDGNAKPNIVFAVDDSGSMDYEVVTTFTEPFFQTVCDNDGANCKDISYKARYLFNSGASPDFGGGWLTTTGRGGQLPFINRFKYLRSPDYNAAYFDPDDLYTPWKDASVDETYGDVSPTAAPYEPTLAGSLKLDLTSDTKDTAGNTFYPATYYVRLTEGNYSQSGVSKSCGTDGAYKEWVDQPGTFNFPDGIDGFGPDNACLQEVEITAGTPEMQNFANWFSYYRRLHHTTRAAIGEALRGLSGMNLDIFWINQLDELAMMDLDTQGGAFLSDSYNHFNSTWTGGGTPLRKALQHAGEQFDSNTNVIEAECQRNYTLLFTDGFNNEFIAGTVNNADGTEGKPYADEASDTLADVAMTYYKRQLRSTDASLAAGQVPLGEACFKKEGDPGYSPYTDIPVETTDPSYDPSADCNVNLHMNTFTIGFGSKGAHIAGQGYDTVADAYDGYPDWATYPDWSLVDYSAEDANQIDDLYHAAVNGRGEFYNATNIADLRKSMSAALRDIIKTTGSATNVTFNTATLEEGSNVYTASFNSGDWSGSVAARALNTVTGAIGNIVWDAADVLNGQPPGNRFIVTGSGNPATEAVDGVLFNWDNLSTAQKADLNSTDSLGEARLAYLRGDRSNEGSIFRTRSTVLGDVVNSSPIFAGRPASAWPDRDPFGVDETPLGDGTFTNTGRYSGFKQSQADRTPIVYAGANDGMLHGFDANSGQELLAYIPTGVYSSVSNEGLKYLTDPLYEHRFYVDLTPAVSDVFIGSAAGLDPEWKTILVGGMRAGGRGVFALDVTNPSQFANTDAAAADLVLWEFADSRLGYNLEAPVVGMVKWGNSDYRWSALISSGYNSDTGETGLFVLDIEAGQDGWDLGEVVFVDLGDTGGLSPLRAVDFMDEDGVMVRDGIIDRVYAGDLQGNLWAIDMTGGSANWGTVYADGNGNNATPVPFFVATDASGNRQPITSAPVMGRNLYNTAGAGANLFVFFGTGQYLSDADPTSTATQSFYGVWDTGTTVLRSELEPRTITQTTDQGFEIRTVSGESIDWTADTAHGWVMDFDSAVTGEPLGERVISSPLVRGEYVLFNTITPKQGLCESGGSSWTMAVRFDGTTPDRAVFDVNNDGSVNSTDGLVAGVRYGDALILNMNLLGDNLYRQASDGEVDQGKIALGGGKTLGRSGWREIYQE